MLRLIIIVTISILLVSCTAVYNINVRKDGTAFVKTDRDADSMYINRFYLSNIISDIDTIGDSASPIRFEISNIDSLGNYLPIHPPGFFRFDMEEDTLIITDGHTVPFKVNHWSCCNIYMYIISDKDIQSVELVSGYVKKVNERTIEIFRGRNHLVKGKNKTDVRITYTP